MTKNTAKRRAFLALGGNIPHGDLPVVETLQGAVQQLFLDGIQCTRLSKIYHTPCFPKDAGPDFVNAVVEISFRGSLSSLLTRCHEVEARFGRTRDARWSARTIDIDIIACGQVIRPTAEVVQGWINLDLSVQSTRAPDEMILPHPRIQDRGFVLIPLAEIAPTWTHPILGKTALEMCNAVPEAEKTQIWPISKALKPN